MTWFASATRRPISTNFGGAINPIGVLMHQQVGNGSLFGWFNNPSARVSAHWWVSKTGVIEQYVASRTSAWHARNLNARYCGIEFEGFQTEALTGPQLDGGARLLAEGNRVHGWPLVLANRDGERGFGFHRMPGFDSSTACPSDLRLAQRGEILRRAGAGTGPTPPPPGGGEDEMVLVQAPNGGWVVLNLSSGEFRGLSSPAVLNWYRSAGVRDAPRPPADVWSRFRQVNPGI